VFKLPVEKLIKYLNRTKGSRITAAPRFINKRFNVEVKIIQGRPCYRIEPKESKNNNSGVFFIHGGGWIFEAHLVHWRAASYLVRTLGIPVYFPVYPLIPDSTLKDALTMLNESFSFMTKEFKEENIVIIGDSAGASLTLSLCHWLKQQKLSMPKKLILVSPAMIYEDDPDVLKAMQAIAARDRLVDFNYLQTFRKIAGIKEKDILSASMLGNFSGFPDMHIFSGTYEFMYPQALAFFELLKTQGIIAKLYTGNKMQHVWPYLPFAVECKKALKEVAEVAGEL